MKALVISKEAKADLEQIGDYIALDNPKRAVSFLDELTVKCRDIAQFPESYPCFEDLSETARIAPYKKYVLIYTIHDDFISIERILHGARDIMSLIEK